MCVFPREGNLTFGIFHNSQEGFATAVSGPPAPRRQLLNLEDTCLLIYIYIYILYVYIYIYIYILYINEYIYIYTYRKLL